MSFSWPILMLAQNALTATFAILSRKIVRNHKYETLPLSIVTFALIAVGGAMYGVVTGEKASTNITQYFWTLLFTGICFALSKILNLLAFEYVEAATASILAVFDVIASVILSSLLLQERLTGLQLIGGLVVVVSMCLGIYSQSRQVNNSKSVIATVVSLLAGLLFAIGVNAEKYLLDNLGVATYLFWGWGAQFICVFIIASLAMYWLKVDKSTYRNKHFLKLAVPAGIVRTFSGLLYILALFLSDNLSLISVFLGLRVIFVVLLGAVILGEHSSMRKKSLAGALATLGIAIMLWK